MSGTSGVSEAPEISVLVSCYFEEATIDEFHARLSASLAKLGRSYEMLFVNDGSTDATWAKLNTIFDEDPHVSTIVDFYRNAGQAAAKTSIFEHARGRMWLFLDSDLQLDPEEIPLLVAKFDEGYDIVSGYRKDRRDPLARRLPSVFANMAMRRIARHPVRDFGCTFKIYDAQLVRAFEFGPFKPWRPAYVFARAGRCAEVAVTHHERKHGSSGWTFRKLLAYQMDNLVGVSQRPFQMLSLICFLAALMFLLRIVLAWVYPVSLLSTVSPGLILNVLIFQLLLTLAVLSTIGEYVLRNFVALQRYPAYVVRTLRKR